MKTWPMTSEYAPAVSGYISLMKDQELLPVLYNHLTLQLLAGITEEQAAFQYAEGKWSIKEVVGHMADTERIMSYRALRVSRGDRTALPGFDQEPFTEAARFNQHSFHFLLEDFANVRRSTLSMMKQINDSAWLYHGNVSGHEMSVRAIATVIAGHELHHANVLKQLYLCRL